MNDVKVIFDVGAKETTYPIEYPKAVCHLFEPNPIYFELLPKGKNIHANNYGLGDKIEELQYDNVLETFVGSEALPNHSAGPVYQIKTLDWYIKENDIKSIDFLKIDTEGMDYKVLLGGREAIKLARYIQYEYWDNKEQFIDLLGASFEMTNVGLRNVLCKKIL